MAHPTPALEWRAATRDDVPELIALARSRTPNAEPWRIATWFEENADLDAAPAVWLDGRLAGFGLIGHRRGMPEDNRILSLFVAHHGSGIGLGTELHERCLAAVGPTAAACWVPVHDDDPISLEIATHWGYEIVQRSIASRIDPTGARVQDPPGGVELEACGELLFDDPDAFDAMLLASQTNPEARTSHVFTRTEMVHWADSGEVMLGALARVDGIPAAVALAIVDPGLGEGGVPYTGVDPRYRGRGLAMLVKQHLHHQAAQLGIRKLSTDNEENNAGIRRVNQQLGYQQAYGVYRMRRTL